MGISGVALLVRVEMGGTNLSPPVEISLIPSEVTFTVIGGLECGVEISSLSSSE